MTSQVLFKTGSVAATLTAGALAGTKMLYSKFPSTIEKEAEKVVETLEKEKGLHFIGYFGAGSKVINKGLDPRREVYFAPAPHISQSYAKADARRHGGEPKLAFLVADKPVEEHHLEATRADTPIAKHEGLEGAVPYQPISSEGQKDIGLRIGHVLPVTPHNDDTFWGHLDRFVTWMKS